MWRRRLREAVTWSTLLALLVGFGVVVWATHHPDHPILEGAEDWPVVGLAVARFRAYYGVGGEADVAAAGDSAAAAPGSGEAAQEEGVEIELGVRGPLGGGAAPAAAAGEHVWVAAGQEVRREPRDGAEVMGRLEVYERLEVLRRAGDWVRLATPVGTGWVRTGADEAGGSGDADYPLGSGLVPPRPLASAVPDDAQLTAARELLGLDAPVARIGPYDLYTDVGGLEALYHLDRLAAEVEPAYRRRYGRQPVGVAREAVLVFAEENRYRLFQMRDRRLEGLPAAGHAGSGIVALYVGDRRRNEVAATLIHELVHMLNRRALGPALPPWLDEGMADDLGGSYVGPAGDLEPGRLGGDVVRRPQSTDYFGAQAALRKLNAANARGDNRPRLEELVDRDWSSFVHSAERDLHYAHAGFFVRYLVDGEEGALVPGFQRFLDSVADGGPAVGEALRRELGRSWEELDAGLGEFVRGLVLEGALQERGTRRGDAEAGEEGP